MNNPMKQVKTIDEIKLRTWINLVEIIDLSPDNDWEKIGIIHKRT